MSDDPLTKSLALQERILANENLNDAQLTALYDDFGRNLDRLTEAQRDQVWAARDALERRATIRKLDRFFALSEPERTAWLDAEIAKRAPNDAAQRAEEARAANLPPTAVPTGAITGAADDARLDAVSRQMLDAMPAEDRAKITEYERLYCRRLTQKSGR